jgi:CheY-like chemotaxis protein
MEHFAFEVLSSQSIGVLSGSFANNPKSRRKKNTAEAAKFEKKAGNRVLLVGRMRELALYRAEFLQSAGFSVTTASDVDSAIRVMRRGGFDAIVLSYTLPNESVEYLANAARDYCADCPVIAIAETKMFDRRIAPDAIAIADDGPPALLSALRRVLQGSH